MRATWRAQGVVGVGLVLLVPLLHLDRLSVQSPPSPPLQRPLHVREPRSAFEEALQAASDGSWQAEQAVNADLTELDAWDPQAATGDTLHDWRLQQLAADRGGCLRRAREAARRAAALAQTLAQEYRVARSRSLIEHATGDHLQELQQPRLLVKLRPHDRITLAVLYRAAQCNGLQQEERQTRQIMEELGYMRGAGKGE